MIWEFGSRSESGVALRLPPRSKVFDSGSAEQRTGAAWQQIL